MEKDKKYNVVLGLMIFLFVIFVGVCVVWGIGAITMNKENSSKLGTENNKTNVVKSNKSLNDVKSIHEKMVEYMNEKYDDVFTYNAPFGGSIGEKSKQITVKSEKYPDSDIWVEYSYSEDKYYDNYVDYKFEAQTKEYMTQLMKSMFKSNLTVDYSVDSGGTRNSYDDSTSFEEYIKGESNPIYFRAHIDMNIEEQDHKTVIDLITTEFVKKRNMRVVGDIYFTKNHAGLFFITNNEGIETERWD